MRLNYFKAIANSYFKSFEGKEIFYPWGIWGKGFVIPSKERAEELKSLFHKIIIGSLCYTYFTLFMLKAFGLPVGVGFILLYLLVYHVSIQTITRHFEISSVKLTLGESSSSMALALSWLNLLLLLLGSLLFLIASIRIMLQDNGFGIGITGVLFFGLCFGLSTYQFIKKCKVNKDKSFKEN